jgi:hypothetical protein
MRLIITPDGRAGLLDVSMDPAQAAGRNDVKLLSGRPDQQDDGTYVNHGH